eukprot:TRINITY_DN4769_c0_g1_i1.p1 TRINITY_DN4769_c0_g1~~TRINITY_DN4769_c0_g1_i1.p1  ORF type:complete len:633 (+),score=74.81 TRINITY_DN4769_c0_g1_i1:104-2002(+)
MQDKGKFGPQIQLQSMQPAEEVGIGGKRGKPEPSYELFVVNVPQAATQEDIAKFFFKYGTVANVKISQKAEDKLAGIAFVTFKDKQSYENAKKANGGQFYGETIRVGNAADFIPVSEEPKLTVEEGKTKIVIENLSPKTTSESLADFFKRIGFVKRIEIVSDPGTNKRTGYVSFQTEEATKKALMFSAQPLDGFFIRIRYSTAEDFICKTTEFSSVCKKHGNSEITQYCKECKKFLCFDCTIEHSTEYPKHFIASIQGIVMEVIKVVENKKSVMSPEVIFEKKLGEFKDAIVKIKEKVNEKLDEILKSQVKLVEETLKLCAHRDFIDSKTENIGVELVKRLYMSKEFDKLISIYDEQVVSKDNGGLAEEKSKGRPNLEFVNLADFVKELERKLKNALTDVNFVKQICGLCGKQSKISQCERCHNFVCKECLKKCAICTKTVCEKCKGSCHERPKYVWSNGEITIDRSKKAHTIVSTTIPLPKAFKVILKVKDFKETPHECKCWSIGLSERSFIGVDEYEKGNRSRFTIGWASEVKWKEYGWAPCSCRMLGINGRSKNNKYGKPVVNAEIALILNKGRKLSAEIDGVSQGTMHTIPEGDYYLALGAAKGKGEITIVSVEELQAQQHLFIIDFI